MGSRDGVKEGLEKRVSNGRSILVLETETSRSGVARKSRKFSSQRGIWSTLSIAV